MHIIHISNPQNPVQLLWRVGSTDSVQVLFAVSRLVIFRKGQTAFPEENDAPRRRATLAPLAPPIRLSSPTSTLLGRIKLSGGQLPL